MPRAAAAANARRERDGGGSAAQHTKNDVHKKRANYSPNTFVRGRWMKVRESSDSRKHSDIQFLWGREQRKKATKLIGRFAGHHQQASIEA